MTRSLLLVAILCLLSTTAFAQKPSVFFDYEKGHFNENQPMPAESYFMLNSAVSAQVKGVVFRIHRDKPSKNDEALYEAFWKRPTGDASEVLSLPVNYRLRGGSEYDFEILYFREVTPTELLTLNNSLSSVLKQYLTQSLTPKSKSDRLAQNAQQAYEDLNDLLQRSLKMYRSYTDTGYPHFSDLVKNRLKQAYKQNFKKAEVAEKTSAAVNDIADMLLSEADYFLQGGLMIVADKKVIDNYPVEKVMNILTLQIGYAATHFDGDIEKLEYGTGMQLGLVLPLGRKAFSSAFLSNSSIVAGFYLQDFEHNGETISGPIFGRPLYAGLGYNIFRFARINAGVSVLEDTQTANTNSRVYVRPFIGISADIKLWFDLAK